MAGAWSPLAVEASRAYRHHALVQTPVRPNK